MIKESQSNINDHFNTGLEHTKFMLYKISAEVSNVFSEDL
jgi:hypothetical protein